ncbi:MAG: thiamine diphosphokinase [Kiritimatiellia bacterium]
MARTAILVNGAPPTHPVARAAFATAARLVCCDGACRVARALGREPDLVVGDGDSLSAAEATALGDRWVRIAEQETNDLDKAFRTVLDRFGATGEIVILGAGGLREDHFLGNLFRLPRFARRAPNVEMITDAGVFTVVLGERTYACAPRDAVSVFAPEPGTHARSQGLEWPLDGVALDELWMGTLNRTTGAAFTLRADRPLIVYRPFAA